MKSFFFSLCVAASSLLWTNSAVDQRYIITPIEDHRDVERRELERRVWMLERAVNELQIKVYNLQNQPSPTPSATPAVVAPNPKKFFCSVKAFGKTFKAFGATEVETREKVMSDCSSESNEMHCKDLSCKLNQ